MEPFILFLHGGQVSVLIDALVAFANSCEAEGDVCGCAPICDELCEKLRELQELDHIEAIEAAKSIGLGRFKHRPQG